MTHNFSLNSLDPLSEDELLELDGFLLSEATSDDTMAVDMLDGFLTAVVIGPTTLQMRHWLPRVWGPGKEDAPRFETMEHAQAIIGLIIRLMNSIASNLDDPENPITPLFGSRVYDGDTRAYDDGESWAYGFMCGVDLCRQDWQPLFEEPDFAQIIKPIRLLCWDDLSPEDLALTETPEQRERLTLEIAGTAAAIHEFWLEHRQAMYQRTVATLHRNQAKTGRNDSCPCGSGKKFKKCCGAGVVLH